MKATFVLNLNIRSDASISMRDLLLETGVLTKTIPAKLQEAQYLIDLEIGSRVNHSPFFRPDCSFRVSEDNRLYCDTMCIGVLRQEGSKYPHLTLNDQAFPCFLRQNQYWRDQLFHTNERKDGRNTKQQEAAARGTISEVATAEGPLSHVMSR